MPSITLPASAKGGAASRIVATLQPVPSRGDVHYVISESGVAYLHGKSLRQRAEALIAVAAPRFRDELMAYAVESKLLSRMGAMDPVLV